MIELEQISKTFADAGREVHAVNNVSLTIRNGDVFGIIGFSGAGKSTFLKILSGQLDTTNGNIVITPGQRLSVLEQDTATGRS